MSPKVAIIIVIWNGKADTLECLHSLSADTYPNKEIVIVDNGSTDGTVSEVRRDFPATTIIETGLASDVEAGAASASDYHGSPNPEHLIARV